MSSCNLQTYLETKHAEFAEIVKELCIGYVLHPKKPGLAILVPSGGLLKEIRSLADGKYEDASKAREIVKSLCLKAKLKTVNEWHSAGGDIPNWLGQSVPHKVESGKVMVNGSEAVPDKAFIDKSEHQNLAVWVLDAGSKGVGTKNPESKHKYDDKDKAGKFKGKKGSYEGGAAPASGLRGDIMAAVELKASQSSIGTASSIFIMYASNLINYLEQNYKSVFERVAPLISLDSMVDLYVLVDPYYMADRPLLDDLELSDWWSQVKDMSSVPSAINKIPFEESHPKVNIEMIRADTSYAPKTVEHIRNIYETLSKKNELPGVSNVYKAPTAEFLAANLEFKLLVDQLRFAVAMKESTAGNDPVMLDTLINMISEYMENRGRGVTRLLLILSCPNDKYMVLHDDSDVALFVNSDYFLANILHDHPTPDSIKAAYTALQNGTPPDCVFHLKHLLKDYHARVLSEADQKTRAMLEKYK